MRNNDKLIFVLISILLTSSYFCFEDPETLNRREEYYSNIGNFSNNLITLGKSSSKGLSCIAKSRINSKDEIFRVKREFSVCSFDLFPFKYEISEALNKYPSISQSLNKISNILLTYYLTYLLHADKELVKDFIIKRELTEYYKTFKPNDSLTNSFPDIVPTAIGYSTKELTLLQSLGYYSEEMQEMGKIFQFVASELTTHRHIEAMYPWISNPEDLQQAFSIVISRSKSFSLDNYLKLNDLVVSKLSANDKRNYQLNYFFGKNDGGNCIVSFVDLCNHYQPRYKDMRDNNFAELEAEKGVFVVRSKKSFKPGQEVVFTYSNEPNNIKLLNQFGFNIRNNIFNLVLVEVKDSAIVSAMQNNLFKELRCFQNGLYTPKNEIMTRHFSFNSWSLDTNLLNYARVMYFSDNMEQKEFLKTIANKNIVSFNNEIQSLSLYLKAVESKISELGKRYNTSIINIQKSRQAIKNLFRKWKTNKNLKELKAQMYQRNIYEFELYNLNIPPKQRIMAANVAIKLANDEVSKLRRKFIS